MKTRLIATLVATSLCCNTVLAQSAIHLPDMGDVATADLSHSTEREVGESIMQDIRWRDPAYLDDPEVREYLNRLGSRLAAASPGGASGFEFFVVRDPTLNAFALPGGYIGVHSGLILATESESELASVLGHEIAHVSQRHIAQLVGQQSKAGMLLIASMLLAVLAARSDSQVGEAAIAAGQAGVMQSQLGYTREFEREADRLGLQTLDQAGFDVRGMPMFFERLQRNSRLYENNAPSYLRTHPLTVERIADMANRVENMRYRQVPDSADFPLIRARLRAGEGSPGEALRRFEAMADQQAPAVRYGLAYASLRAGQTERAARLLNTAFASATPLGVGLHSEVLLAAGRPQEAVALLKPAFAAAPERHSLAFRLIEAHLAAGQAPAAAALARSQTRLRPEDPVFWQLLARSEAAQGHRLAQHRAQAEFYVLQGSLPEAIVQLENARKAGDGDFYTLSAVDARLNELKRRLRDLRADKEGSRP